MKGIRKKDFILAVVGGVKNIPRSLSLLLYKVSATDWWAFFFFQRAKKGKESEKTWQEKVAASKSTAASDTKSKLGYTNSTLGI